MIFGKRKVGVAEALEKLPGQSGERWAVVLEHGRAVRPRDAGVARAWRAAY